MVLSGAVIINTSLGFLFRHSSHIYRFELTEADTHFKLHSRLEEVSVRGSKVVLLCKGTCFTSSICHRGFDYFHNLPPIIYIFSNLYKN